MAILKEVMTNEASVLMDSDAANKALDADAALQELGSDLVGEAYVTATVTVWDEDPAHRRRAAAPGREDHPGPRLHLHAREASTRSRPGSARLPGHVYANVRQPPVSTLNLAHMMPFSAVWAGPERDEHFQAPPLFFARTEGSTPFRFSPACRRCRPHADRRPDRRRQERAAGADGAAVPPLRRRAGLRLRFRRLDPRGRARHGRRLARSRRRAGRRRSPSPSPCSRWRASTMPASAPGRPNGSRRCSPARPSPSPRN